MPIAVVRSYTPPTLKFNPHHEPAGSPEGGQFASNVATVTITDKASALAVDKARFHQEDEDIAKYGGRALDAHQIIHYIAQDGSHITGAEVCQVRMDSKTGRVLSAIEYDFNEKGRLTIQLLGSVAHGEGTYWIRKMEGIAREKKLDVVLDALKKAVPFYEKMGFEKRPSGSRSLQRMRKKFIDIQAGKDIVVNESDEEIGALVVNEKIASLLGGKELKFNPNHQPAGSSEGGQFAPAEGGSSIYYEVAPDPNNAPLTGRWNKLTDAEKQEVSESVAQQMAPKVLSAAELEGDSHAQIGGYEGATNPSFAIDVSAAEGGKLVPAANLLGYALSQDSMMVVSVKPFPGSDPVGVITVHLPSSSKMADVSKVYDQLWTLKDGDQHLVGGHSTANGQMNILNFSSLPNEEFAARIDAHLKGEYNIDVRQAHVAFPQKADYGQNLPAGYSIPSGQSTGTGRADRLRGEATTLIEEELTKRGKSAEPGTLKATTNGSGEAETLGPLDPSKVIEPPTRAPFERGIKRLGKEPYVPPKSLKFNPNHQPGGSPEGGEFAPAEGGTGTGTTGTPFKQPSYANINKMPTTIEGVTIIKENFKNRMLAMGSENGIALNTSRSVAVAWKDMGAYMKKAYADGWQSSSDENHVINHELAHVLVKRGASIDRQSYLSNLNSSSPRFVSLAAKVSTYAKVNGHEFLSEVFAGVRGGRTFGKDVMDFYKELGGPDPTKDHTPKPIPPHLDRPSVWKP